jgi:AraC-like DNA-binding protein
VRGEAFLEALMERDLGITVNDFITHVRINRAKMLIEKDTEIPEAEVARQTGFAESSAFSAMFKKITGATFEAYVQAKRKQA